MLADKAETPWDALIAAEGFALCSTRVEDKVLREKHAARAVGVLAAFTPKGITLGMIRSSPHFARQPGPRRRPTR